MLEIKQHISLKSFNTFGVEAKAKWWVEVTSEEQLLELAQSEFFQKESPFILGAGSNVLFTQDVDRLVVHSAIKGIRVVESSSNWVRIAFGAGEVWHDAVMHCIDHHWGGVENLALIPGTIGAAPVQNIGAYGVELKDVLHSIRALDRVSGRMVTLHSSDCAFGYRTSIFKAEAKDRYIITEVVLQLTTHSYGLHTDYGAIRDELNKKGVLSPTIRDIATAVIAIRSSKLPDPSVLGNAGSYFKNPTVNREVFERLKTIYPTMPSYPAHEGVKLSAGWLIEQCGWKGYREGNCGCYEKQALVLVNFGGATGREIIDLAQRIRESVFNRFQINLEAEVNAM
jgi:UDP-N-acetylmuramate dehydrogenase